MQNKEEKIADLKRYASLLLICIGIFVTGFMYKEQDIAPPLSEESEMLYGFVKREGKKLGEKYHMTQSGVGGGSNHGITLMSLSFHRQGPLLTEAESRELLINCLHEYLDRVNEDEALRPFLKVYPFKPANINLRIINYSTDKRSVLHPYISAMMASEGRIGFFTDDPCNPYIYKYKKYETYDEAVAILNAAQEAH